MPPRPPIRAFRAAKVKIVFVDTRGTIADMIITGATFCQVVKIIHMSQDREYITWGNQKWNGAAPILIIILKSISVVPIS